MQSKSSLHPLNGKACLYKEMEWSEEGEGEFM